MSEATKPYEAQMHQLQRERMAKYFDEMTALSEGGSGYNAHLLVSGNPVELLRAFDILPVYPEVNALQIAVKKQALPFIQKAEEMGYSIDNCAYVKADIGCFFSGRETNFGTIPLPSLLLCYYVGCNVYLQWFEHLAEYTGAPIFNLDVPFLREGSEEPTPAEVNYVVK